MNFYIPRWQRFLPFPLLPSAITPGDGGEPTRNPELAKTSQILAEQPNIPRLVPVRGGRCPQQHRSIVPSAYSGENTEKRAILGSGGWHREFFGVLQEDFGCLAALEWSC